MERVSYELYNHLSYSAEVKLVKYSGSNKWLPLFLVYAFLKSCFILLNEKVDVIYLQDGLLSPLGVALKELFKKEKELCLLIGTDQATDFEEWYRCEEILKMVDVFVFKRSKKEQKYPRGLKILNSKIIEISSTEIRDKIKKGEPVDYLLPEGVLNYIKEHNLYKN